MVIIEDDFFEDYQFDVVVDGVGYVFICVLVFVKVRSGGVIVYIGLGSVEGGFDICCVILQEIIFVGIYIYIV